jgi:hypothetical protein
VEARFELSEYEKDSARKASYLLHNLNISRTSRIGRELYKVSDIGTSALTDKAKLQKVQSVFVSNNITCKIDFFFCVSVFSVVSDSLVWNFLFLAESAAVRNRRNLRESSVLCDQRFLSVS